jgi:hypothetical protein
MYVGWTPLHEAAIHGYPDIVAKLLRMGADPNVLGMDNDSPLHDAAANSHTQVATILLRNGAIPDQRNCRGERPLDLATDDCLIEILRKHTYGQLSDISSASQETVTGDSLEEAFQPLNDSSELDTEMQVDDQWNTGALSPQLSPIKSGDEQTNSKDLQACLVVNGQDYGPDYNGIMDPSVLSLSLKPDDSLSNTESSSDQPSSDYQQDIIKSVSPQTDATPSDERSTSTTDLSSSNDQLTTCQSGDSISSTTQATAEKQTVIPMGRKRFLYSQVST